MTPRGSKPPPRPRHHGHAAALSGRQASEAHVLELQVLIDAVFAAFGAQPGLFDPSEHRLRGGNQPLIDPNHPNLHRLGNTPDLTHVLGEEVTCGQTSILVILGQMAGLTVKVRGQTDSPARPMLDALAIATASSSVLNLIGKVLVTSKHLFHL